MIEGITKWKMNADNNEKVEKIEDLSDLEEAERIEINIPDPLD